MEGDYQIMNQNLIENDAEGVANNDDVSEDAKLVQVEILKMKEAKQKTFEHTLELQQKLDQELKAIQEKQTAKMKLEKEIVELEDIINDDKYQNDTMKTDISKMREMSKEIGKYCVRNEHILQQTSQDKTAVIEKNETLKTKLFDSIAKFEEVHKKKQSQVILKQESVPSQREIYHDCLENREDECLSIKEKLELSNKELEDLKKQSDELLHSKNSCLNTSANTETDNKTLEEIWNRKQKRSGDLLQQMEEDLQAFEQRKEEISNSLDEARFLLQKKETEIEGVQRGLKNQTEYNKNFREKLSAKIKEIAELRLQNEQFEAAQKDKDFQVSSNQESLTAILNTKLEEEKNAQALLSEERDTLNKTEEQIKDVKQINEELLEHIQLQENIVAELKNKQNCQLEAMSAFEQELLPLQLKLSSLKEELSEWQTKFVKYECNMLEAIANKTSSKESAVTETKEIKYKKEEATNTIMVQEMELIKLNFDIDTAQETSDFEGKQKQLQQQIEMIEKELSYSRTLQIQLDEELEQLNKNCDNISNKIKHHESLNQAFGIVPEPPVVTLLPAVDGNFRAASSSTVTCGSKTGKSSPFNFLLPPSGPMKPRDVDEISGGSSSEGNVVTYQQLLEMKREKQRRRQLRDQKRAEAKKSATLQRKAADK